MSIKIPLSVFIIAVMLFFVSPILNLINPIVYSAVSVNIEVDGTWDELTKSNIFSPSFTILGSGLQSINFSIGYSNRQPKDSQLYKLQDYPRVFIRMFILELIFPILLTLLLITYRSFFQISFQKIRVFSILGIIISACFLIFLVFERTNGVQIFFPETAKFFLPLRIQPDPNEYLIRAYGVTAFFGAFIYFFSSTFRKSPQNESYPIKESS